MHRLTRLTLLCSALSPVAVWAQTPTTITAVDFSDESGVLYVPAQQLSAATGWPVSETAKHELLLDNRHVQRVRTLFDGTHLIPLKTLKERGAAVVWDPVVERADVKIGAREFTVQRGAKRVVVNKAVQELRAYQGDLLVMKTHVSTGRPGHGTPSGSFVAGSKERMHYSQLYDDAEMPWAVQVNGNVFIHGYPSVPRYPASHGCIRMPLRGRYSAARYFYTWVTLGTPVSVGNTWPDSSTGFASNMPPKPPAINVSLQRKK